MDTTIKELAEIFRTMVDNYHTFGAVWKNIALGKQAFELMKSLPPTVKEEFKTPADKAALLGNMLEQMEETQAPRFCIEVRQYMQVLNPDNPNNLKALEKLHDYINLDFPMEEYCQKHRKSLKFDPVERTPQWEECIYQVEEECDRLLQDCPRRMGFCFAYWDAKEKVLLRYGIEWKSPSMMNPRVMFD